MRKLLVTVIIVAFCGLICQLAPQALAQPSYPLDFQIEAISGGFAPWTHLYMIEIRPNATATYSRMVPEDRGDGVWTKIGDFNLTTEQMDTLYDSVQTNDFFTLTNESSILSDGTFAEMTITADAETRMVQTENIKVERFDAIARTINNVTPAGYDLFYNAIFSEAPSPLFTETGVTIETNTHTVFIPVAAILLSLPILGGLFTAFGLSLIARKTGRKSPRYSLRKVFIILILATTVFSPVYAKTTVTRVQCSITVTLHVEFWSEDDPFPITDYQADINDWKAEIEEVWNQDGRWRLRCPAPPCVVGLDGEGCSITFTVDVEMRRENVDPRPGYHQIKIVHDISEDMDGHISSVTLEQPNGGSGQGTWDTNEPANTAAHEAGHLMGEEDQYEEVSQDPRVTRTKTGHENDLMGTLDGKPLPDAVARIVCTKGGADCPKDPCCPDREGGFVVPVDTFSLLAPYVGATATILIAVVATAVYIKRVKSKNEKQ